MKDVISVDSVFKELVAVYDEAGVIGEVPSKVGFAIVGIPEAKQQLYSLLISKLPEKMVRSEIFEGESDGTIEAYNSAIDDMRKSIDEMFEVKV